MYCITGITNPVVVVDMEFWQWRPNRYLFLWDNIFASIKYSFQAEELMDWHIICNSRQIFIFIFFFRYAFMQKLWAWEHHTLQIQEKLYNTSALIVYYRWIKASLSLWEYHNKASIPQLNNALPSPVLSNVCSQEKRQSFGSL